MDLQFPLDRIFFRVLAMGLSGGFVIVFVLLARLVLRRAPKRCVLILWAVALARLLVPLAIESPFTLLPFYATPVSQTIYTQAQPAVDTGIQTLDAAVNASLPAAVADNSMNPIQGFTVFGMLIWLLGVLVGVGYLLGSSLHLRKRLRGAARLRDNLYCVPGLGTPFVAGVLRPKIYLPTDLSETETACIVRHEQMHLRRRDPLWKALGFLAVCVHWFNPLVWLAFFLSARDLELACDEAAAKNLCLEEKKAYCTCLLTLATGKRATGLTPTAFSEGNVSPRIRRVLQFKKPPRWASALLLVAVAVCAAALLTNPVSATRERYEITQLSYGQELQTAKNDALGHDVVWDVLAKSAAFPSQTQISQLPVYYRVRRTLRTGWQVQTDDFYTYLLDGRAVMQREPDNRYSFLSDHLYAQLERLFHDG